MAHVQSVIGTANPGTGNSASVTGSVVGVGNSVVGYFLFRDVTAQGTVTVADDKSNSYTLSSVLFLTPDRIFAYRLDNIINGPSTITASTTEPSANVTFMQVGFSEYSGVRFDTWINPPVHQTTPGTGTDAITSGNMTTSGNGNTIWGATLKNGSTNTIVAGTGFTSRVNDTFWFMQFEDKTQATHGAVAATFTDATEGGGVIDYRTVAISLTPRCLPGSLALLGVGCGMAARKIEENPIIRRRELILPIGR